MSIKKWNMVILFFFVFIGLLGQMGKSRMKEINISNIEDFLKLDCELNYIYGMNREDEKECYDSFVKYETEYVQSAKNAENVMIGKFTGEISIDGMALGVWVKVEQSLKGISLKEGERIPIYIDYLLSFGEQGKKIYNNTINMMKLGDKYLIFYEPSELNTYQKEKEYRFATEPGYYNLSETTSKPVDVQNMNMNSVSNNEFFASSERIIKRLEKIKKKVISYYLFE